MGTMPRFQREFDGGTSCLRWRNGAFAWLRRNPPDLTVLVFSDDYRLADKKNRKVAGERRIRALQRGLTRTVSMLPDASSVVLLADSPKQTLNPVACLKRSRRDMSACVTLAAPASAKRTDAALRKAVTDAGGTYLSLEDRICPYRPCPLVQGDTLIYRDQGHLTVTFTRLLAPSLRKELASLLPPDPIDEPPQTEPASSAAPDEAQP